MCLKHSNKELDIYLEIEKLSSQIPTSYLPTPFLIHKTFNRPPSDPQVFIDPFCPYHSYLSTSFDTPSSYPLFFFYPTPSVYRSILTPSYLSTFVWFPGIYQPPFFPIPRHSLISFEPKVFIDHFWLPFIYIHFKPRAFMDFFWTPNHLSISFGAQTVSTPFINPQEFIELFWSESIYGFLLTLFSSVYKSRLKSY